MKKIAVTAMAAAITAATSYADDSNSIDTGIEELIVTGTKQNLSLQDTQASVSVLNAEDIKNMVVLDVEDIILRTANVSTAGNGGLNQISVRGITNDGVGFTGAGQTVSIYVDGSPNSFNSNQGAANLWDVAQVEILRGPQSTVQGRNALAGAVIINTADPEYEFRSTLRVRGGSEDLRQYSGMVTGSIIEDQLAFRLSADTREIDFGVVNQITGNNTRFQDATTIRGKLLFEPEAVSGLRMELALQHIDTEFGEFNSVTAPGPAGTSEFEAFDPFGNKTYGTRTRFEFNVVDRAILDTQYELNENWTLYSIATYEKVDRDTKFGPEGASFSDDKTKSFEFRAAYSGERLSGWLGAYYFEQERPNEFTFEFNPSLFGFPTDPAGAIVSTVSSRTQEFENYAIFGDLTYELSHKWSINVGARFDREDYSDTGNNGTATATPANCTVPAFGGLPCTMILPIQNEPPTDTSFDAFLPRATLIHSFDEDRSLSFGIQRGYRAGGTYIRVSPTTGFELGEFDPEYITNYELAFRSQWFDQRLTVNANMYYSDWTDQQVTIQFSPAFFDAITTNSGESELYGTEIDIVALLSDELEVRTSLGYVHTEFKDFPFNGENLRGNEFNSSPNFNASFGLNYQHISGLFTDWTVSYSDGQYSDVQNRNVNETDSYTLVNARLGYSTDLFDVVLFANNLFDERVTTRQDVTTAQPFFNVNDPRVVGLELTLNY